MAGKYYPPLIFPATSQAKPDLALALQHAATNHQRILLNFGTNWSEDSLVLNRYLHDVANQPIAEANYILVPVNIAGRDYWDHANSDLAKQYSVPIEKCYPALAVLDGHGQLVYSQQRCEFANMRNGKSPDVTAFLLRWKPQE